MSKHSWDICGTAYVDIGGAKHECNSVVCYSPMGIETWLTVDKETGELYNAERIDGEWISLDLDQAREEFADVLYCVG